MVDNQQEQMALPFPSKETHYKPAYNHTDEIAGNLEDLERAHWAFDRLIVEPKYEGWLRRRAFVRSGHHTLHIEGNTLNVGQVAEILDNPDVTDQDGEKEEVRNWNRAMQFVDSVSAATEVPITPLLVRHVHSLVLGPYDSVHLPGDYRRGEARVRHPISRKPVYIGPLAGDVADLMHQFGRWLANDASQLHPVLAAGIAHLRLVEIHPFVDGNGRTARALTTLLLQRRNYSFNKLLAIERYFDVDLMKYCSAISETVGASFEDGRDLTGWLEYFTSAMAIEVSIVSEEVIGLRRLMEEWHEILSESGYSERHRDILVYAGINDGIRTRDVIRIGKVSGVTASDDLRRLEKAGLLKAEGHTRARIYRRTEDLWDRL